MGRRRAFLRRAGWAAGIILVAALLAHLGWRPIARALLGAGPRIAWMILIYAAAIAVMAVPWRLLIDGPARPDWGATFCSRLAASGLNALLPFVAAGEVTRLLWLPRRHWCDGIAALVVDRLLFALASASSLALAAFLILRSPRVPHGWAIGALIVTAILIAGIGLALAVASWGTPARRLGGSLARFRRAAESLLRADRGDRGSTGPARAGLVPDDVDAALRAVLAGSKLRILAVLGIHLLGRVLLTAEFCLALDILGMHATIDAGLILAAIPVALGVVGAIFPSQIGIQEGAQAAVTAALGLGPAAGVLVVLLQRARQVCFLPLTFLALALRPTDRSAPSSPRHPGPPIST